jgi:hypothetical protein
MELMNECGLKSASYLLEIAAKDSSLGINENYVVGYAQALYDAGIINEREGEAYVKAAVVLYAEKLLGGDDD